MYFILIITMLYKGITSFSPERISRDFEHVFKFYQVNIEPFPFTSYVLPAKEFRAQPPPAVLPGVSNSTDNFQISPSGPKDPSSANPLKVHYTMRTTMLASLRAQALRQRQQRLDAVSRRFASSSPSSSSAEAKAQDALASAKKGLDGFVKAASGFAESIGGRVGGLLGCE